MSTASGPTPRPYVAHEATYRQLLELKPNVAVLPWGATEAHNDHLPHGTDVVEANALGEASVAQANEQGARCVLLPCVPFGNNNTQLTQVCTVTMRTRTQLAVLYDVADSLVKQGINRVVILNFHGGNEFKPLVRDVMLDVPIFIVLIDAFKLLPTLRSELGLAPGSHADEFETSLMLHIKPQWVAPPEAAGDGAATPSALPALNQPGVWCPRDWAALSKDTGDGDPRAATAAKGQHILNALTGAVTPVLIELSNANEGDFPLIIRKWS